MSDPDRLTRLEAGIKAAEDFYNRTLQRVREMPRHPERERDLQVAEDMWDNILRAMNAA